MKFIEIKFKLNLMKFYCFDMYKIESFNVNKI